jgi:hypothetical protein
MTMPTGQPDPENPFTNNESQPNSQAAQPNQSLGQQARTAWGASGQTGVVNAAKFGYQFGKNAAQQGMQGQGGTGVGSQGGVSNGNGGDDELATKGDVNEAASGLHDRLGSIESGMQNAGGVQDRNAAFGQGNGSAPAPQAQGTGSPPSVLQQHQVQTQAALQSMKEGHADLHNSMANTMARFQQRQSQGASMAPQLSGNAMSSNQGSATMNGLVSGGNAGGLGMSQNTFDAKKWGSQS